MPNPERRADKGDVTKKILTEMSDLSGMGGQRGQLGSFDLATYFRAMDYAEAWVMNVEDVNPSHRRLAQAEVGKLTSSVYEEMKLGKHTRQG